MNEYKCTSLELSKKLAEGGCELETYMGWNPMGRYILTRFSSSNLTLPWSKDAYPAYDILNDICCKYSKEIDLLNMLKEKRVDLKEGGGARVRTEQRVETPR